MQKNITILVFSEITRDPRAYKSAIAAADNRYKVTVVCVPNEAPMNKDNPKIGIIRIKKKGLLKKSKYIKIKKIKILILN